MPVLFVPCRYRLSSISWDSRRKSFITCVRGSLEIVRLNGVVFVKRWTWKSWAFVEGCTKRVPIVSMFIDVVSQSFLDRLLEELDLWTRWRMVVCCRLCLSRNAKERDWKHFLTKCGTLCESRKFSSLVDFVGIGWLTYKRDLSKPRQNSFRLTFLAQVLVRQLPRTQKSHSRAIIGNAVDAYRSINIDYNQYKFPFNWPQMWPYNDSRTIWLSCRTYPCFPEDLWTEDCKYDRPSFFLVRQRRLFVKRRRWSLFARGCCCLCW